jgi:hypothetical protein
MNSSYGVYFFNNKSSFCSIYLCFELFDFYSGKYRTLASKYLTFLVLVWIIIILDQCLSIICICYLSA